MTIKQNIQAWLNESQALMIQKYDELGFRASGDWANGLSNEITEGDGKFNAKIEGLHYTYYMEHGRMPGKFPPIAAIKQWIDTKNISYEGITRNSLAFLIARKIAREGTNIRPGVVSDVITQNRIDELTNAIGKEMVNEIRSDIIKTLSNGNK